MTADLAARAADPVAAARAVVGWYGDPTISWSVLLQARLAAPVAAGAVAERLARLVVRYPHLGAPPVVQAVPDEAWPAACAAFADRPYADRAPMVRTAVGTESGLVLVAAHHGATDGLGLLAVLAAALGITLTSQASGIADRPSSSPFLASAARRLAEALFAPPARIAPARPATGRPAPGHPAPGDVLVCADLPAAPVGSAALTAAIGRAAQEWNARHRTPYRRAVAGLGLSRRSGDRATPVAGSAFLRLRLPGASDTGTVRGLIAAQPPEPDFPRSSSRMPIVVTRLLASRLGSTFLASNLGVVHGPHQVRSLAFYPAASGRSGVAVGAATVGHTTTITLRARRSSFDRAGAAELLSMIVARLPAPPGATITPPAGP
ncbi:MAG TPA: hypothetical protein VGJ95_06290 [Pseudonocardiaceae bacterium]